jgi:hypothetical protein
VSGYWSKDDMTIAGMKVAAQPFAEITDASGLAAIYEVGGLMCCGRQTDNTCEACTLTRAHFGVVNVVVHDSKAASTAWWAWPSTASGM